MFDTDTQYTMSTDQMPHTHTHNRILTDTHRVDNYAHTAQPTHKYERPTIQKENRIMRERERVSERERVREYQREREREQTKPPKDYYHHPETHIHPVSRGILLLF